MTKSCEVCAGGVTDRETETYKTGPSGPARAKAVALRGPDSPGSDAPFSSSDKNTEKTVGVTGQVSVPPLVLPPSLCALGGHVTVSQACLCPLCWNASSGKQLKLKG